MKKKLPKIKPCPAGHKASIYSVPYGPRRFRGWCSEDHCWKGPWASSRRAAILAWNKRA